MGGDLKVRVDRARPVCPYCKDEVVGGHVWLCPGCEAPHHSECQRELARCGACGQTDPSAAPSTAVEGTGRPQQGLASAPAKGGEPDAVAARVAELRRLGFAIVDDGDPDEARALLPANRSSEVRVGLPLVVIVRRVDRLTRARFDEELARLAPIARALCPRDRVGYLVPCFLADRVDPEVREQVLTGARYRSAPGLRLYPLARELDAPHGEASYFGGARLIGCVDFVGLRFLARRLLYPHLAPETAAELPVLGLAAIVAFVFLLTLVAVVASV